MTRTKVREVALASLISPYLYVCEQLEKRLGRIPEVSDIQALSETERQGIMNQTPVEFIDRVIRTKPLSYEQAEEVLGPGTLWKLQKMVVAYCNAYPPDDGRL